MRIKLVLFLTLMVGIGVALSQQPVQPPVRNDYEILYKSEGLRTPMFQETDWVDLTGYDVLDYLLDIQIFPRAERVEGIVQITATSVVPSLSTIDVNLVDNMDVSQILRGGSPLTFTHNNDLIHINLGTPVAQGDTFVVEIDYYGYPQAGGLQGFSIEINAYGDTLISTLSEPEEARGWWPCKDMPCDKGTATIRVTIPSHFLFASNGNLTNEENLGGGWKRWTWEESYPITTYLISLAICDYDTFTYTYTGLQGETLPLKFFVYPQQGAAARTDFSIVDDMIGFYASIWQEYPYMTEKYGHAIFEWGGAMEHQTITSIGSGCVTGNHQYDWIYAHELSHMWWGDMVTCETWADLWLNEGFATYSDALWQEHLGGQSGLQNRMSSFRSAYFNEDNTSRFPIYAAPENFLWGATTYQKGSWIQHMLRHAISDSCFWNFYDLWGAQYAYQSATSDEYMAVVSEAAGQDMEWYVHEWVYDAGYPEYQYAWRATDIGGGQWQFDLVISQTQGPENNTPIFKMPIDIDLYYSSAWHRTVVWDSLSQQHFRWNENAQPTQLRFDYNEWVLCTKNQGSMPSEISLACRDQTVVDTLGNCNSGADPGETVDFYIGLQNQGWNDATGVFAELNSIDTNITIVSDTSSYPMISGFMMEQNLHPFVIQVHPSCPVNHSTPLMLNVIASGGYSINLNLNLLIGNPRQLPTGPDTYGYYVYDNHDLEGPVFDWVEISPSLQGPGAAILFSEDDQNMQDTLPFTFMFYGQIHNIISVCSNGWMSPSITYNTDWGNTNIPNSAGPAGFVAAFWDDLSPQLFGEVSYYYDQSNHRFIVEFYRVRQFNPNWAYETFEVILLDENYWQTATGDGEIIIQYLETTAPSSCTIGIENWDENTGLQYFYNGTYNSNAWSNLNGLALKFTTGSQYSVPEGKEVPAPANFVLFQNYPNPFNPETQIRYQLTTPGIVKLDVYNVLGQKVVNLLQGRQAAGEHSVVWNGKTATGLDMASGIYFYRLETGSLAQTRKMMLLK